MTHDPREALDSLLAFRHGDTKHLTAEHARILYEALTASPGEQKPVAWLPDWGQIVQILLRCMDATIKNETSREQAERMANELLEKYPALSAARDEAKKSEGKLAREEIQRLDEQDEEMSAGEDDFLNELADHAANLAPGPSDPTAERREIVALDRQFIIDLIREKYDPVPSDWLAKDANRWDDGTGEIADAILAALDGSER